jgi:hypothetical protein
MENIFVIILLIILIVVLLVLDLDTKKEYLMIDDSKSKAINNVVGNFIINQQTKLPNLSITNLLKVNDVNFNRLILDYKYPIGSFYVQYPDSNITYSSKGDTQITPFPESKTPATLFGGVWIDMWKNESVYFRTGNGDPSLNSIAFETIKVCDTEKSGNTDCKIKKIVDSRIDGFQDYAVRDISGWTSWAQAPYDSNVCNGYTGVFTKCETTKIKTDANGGQGKGHYNVFDTNAFFKEQYPQEYESYISDNEVRVTNRLIKVWKRIK